jgi:hypothetical protein
VSAAAAFSFSFTDWGVFDLSALPPVALAIVIAAAVVALGLGCLIISIHESVLRLLRQKLDVTVPIARWLLLSMSLAGALPIARFGHPIYWLFVAATAITALIALIALERYHRSHSAAT